MASRDQDEMLRELRCTTDFVLIRRRSVTSRKGRALTRRDRRGSAMALWKDRGSPMALRKDRGSPMAERSAAKGKRPGETRVAESEDRDSIPANFIHPPDHFPRPSPLPPPAPPCLCGLYPPPSLSLSASSSRCSSTSSLSSVAEQRASAAPPEDQGCLGAALPCRQHSPGAECGSRPGPQTEEGGPPRVGLAQTSQPAGPPGQCSCQTHSHRDSGCQTEHPFTRHCDDGSLLRQRCPHFRQCLSGPEADSVSPRRSPWLEGWRPETRGVGTCAAVPVCTSCSDRVSGEQVERDDCDNVCRCKGRADSQCLYRRRTCPSDEESCAVSPEPLPAGIAQRTALESLGVGGTSHSEPCNRTSALSSCLRCQQRQRLLPVPSQTRDSPHQQRDLSARHANSQRLCSVPNPNRNASSLPRPALLPTEARDCETWPGSCSHRWRHWSRMWRMRYVGRCLLLLLLTGLGGLFAHVTITDYHVGDQHGGGDVIGGFGGGLGFGAGNGALHPVNMLMKMHMRPVPLREFQARLRTIRNKFDLLRIFVADKDISDDKLKKLLSATAVTSTDTVVQPHVSERVHASPAATGTRATAVPVGAHVQIDVTQSKRASRSDAVLSKPTESVVKNDRGKTYSSMAKLGELLKKTDVAKSEHSSESDADLSQFTERMAKSDVTKNDALTSRSDSDFADDLFDDVRYANVKKRSEAWYDDEYYSDDEVDAEDYIDGEVEYYNDEKTADAILEELEEAVYHIADMESNSQAQCKHPQPQVIYIDDPKKQNRQFYPECTVIHRCRNDSGCCGRNFECAPKTKRVIFQTFLAVNVDRASDTVLLDSRMVERIALVNHTECECREKPRLPDCTQECPGVFRVYRYGWQCVCDCVSTPNERFPQCDRVKDGYDPLTQEDLVCIKSGRCGEPKCSIGQFDVSTGFCPVKDVHSISSDLLRARLRHQHQLRHARRKSVSEGSGDF